MNITDRLQQALNKRKEENAFRALKLVEDKIDFCSNDYLGFANSALLHANNLSAAEVVHKTGATGSRLLTGNNAFIEMVEKDIALFHEAASALFFNSGYEANSGLLSTVTGRGDTIIFDELCHASLREGIRLSNAQSFSFTHNDIVSLELKLEKATGLKFIVIESVYSMDGDIAPLTAIMEVAQKFCAEIILDEAHGTGVIGERGQGLAQQLGVQKNIFARVHTFGKAIGSNGAVVLGSEVLRNYLINFCRPFIYTTAPNYLQLIAVQQAYLLLENNRTLVETLRQRISYFKKQVQKFPQIQLMPSESAIFSIIVPGNENARRAADIIQKGGDDVRAILSPTVPDGKERLRICIHVFNSESEIDRLVYSLAQIISVI